MRRGPLRVLLVNENIGGHATVHAALRAAMAPLPEVEPEFLDVPAPRGLGRLAGAQLPGLARLDLDLQPLRAQLVRAAWVRRALARRLAQGGVDLVHVYTQNAALLATGVLDDLPLVVSTDSTNALNAYRLPYRRPTRWTRWSVPPAAFFEQRVLCRADRVVANSPWVAASLRERYAVPAERLVGMPFGVRLPARPAARPERRPSVVFVGRQLARKGGRRLLALHAAHLSDVCDLVLVTPEHVGPVGPHVRVVGDVRGPGPRLEQVLGDADIMCFPSEIDQAPNAVLEAAAAGLPVVAHPVAGIPEMVLHERTGLLVAPDDDEALVAAVRRLAADHALRARWGSAARAHVESRFDVDRLVREQFVPLLLQVADDAGARRARTLP